MELIMAIFDQVNRRSGAKERGAIGWMVIGIVVGVLLVIFGIIKLLIPGE